MGLAAAASAQLLGAAVVIVDDLNAQRLAHARSCLDLSSQTKQAHWNVKGAQFVALHALFDKLAAELMGHADLIAERATALGGLALGTVRMAGATSRLSEVNLEVTDSRPTVAELADWYASPAADMRRAIDLAERQSNAGTADLFTEVSRGLDKALWFLQAHLQTDMAVSSA